MKDTTFIYGLVDPRTNEVRYVGKANNPKSRYSAHIKNAENNKKKTHCYAWIKSLLTLNLKPELIILEKCLINNWGDRENYWISQYTNLTNLIDGGKFCPMSIPEIVEKAKLTKKINNKLISQETRDKLKISTKKAWENGLMRRNFKHSEKTKEIKRIIQAEIWSKRTEERKKEIGKKITEGKGKKINQYDLQMNYIKTWNSVKEAELFYCGRNKGHMKKQIDKNKSWRGFIWKYEASDPIVQNPINN